MEKIEKFKLEGDDWKKIAFATTHAEDYEADRVIFIQDYPEFTVLRGGHCSCYGFDEIDWEAMKYSREELKKLADLWATSTYDSSEKQLGIFLKNYL